MASGKKRAVDAGSSARSTKAHSSTNSSFRPVNTSARIAVLAGIFILVSGLFLGRLIFLQVIISDEYSQQAEKTRTYSDSNILPRRGTIYDRNGVALAKDVDAVTISADPSLVEDVDYTAAQLAHNLGGTMSDYKDLLTREETNFVYIKREADVEVAKKLEGLALDGLFFTTDFKRVYPNNQTGAQVVGLVDTDGKGLTGLELYYDDILSGTPGSIKRERGNDGIPIPGAIHEETPAINGQDIVISLDIIMQQHLEETLAKGVTDVGGKGGNSILMDGSNGEIIAAASLPYFNASDISEIPEGATQARSITDAFEPGSIFKAVSVSAVLENKAMTPDDEIFCPAVLPADEYSVTDAFDRGDETMSLRQILNRSSNIGISLASEGLGFDKLYSKIVDYNLTELTGVDYPGESSGLLHEQSSWSLIQSYNVSFGQGVSVTPLQMTRYYGALVNDGVECTPHFLIKKLNSEDQPVYETEAVIADSESLSTLSDMLKTVVLDGTATDAAIEGYSVAGKTGTAEIPSEGDYLDGIYNISFIGYLANSSSQLVCFVGATEVPGDRKVTPIFKDIMTFAIDRYRIIPSEG